MHLVLLDKRPIHQAVTGLSSRGLTSSLIFSHPSCTIVFLYATPTYFCLFYFALSVLAVSVLNAAPPFVCFRVFSQSSASSRLCPCYCSLPWFLHSCHPGTKSVAPRLCHISSFSLTQTLSSSPHCLIIVGRRDAVERAGKVNT